MPTLEDYQRIRQLGAWTKENAEMQKSQGSFLERLGNELMEKDDEDYDKEGDGKKKKGMPKAEKIAVIKMLKKAKK